MMRCQNFRSLPLARNQRNEIARKEKIYFFDTGIRNSIIAAFQPVDFRTDTGALFENLMVMERLKYHPSTTSFALITRENFLLSTYCPRNLPSHQPAPALRRSH